MAAKGTQARRPGQTLSATCAISRSPNPSKRVRTGNRQVVIRVTATGSHSGRFSVPLELGSYMRYFDQTNSRLRVALCSRAGQRSMWAAPDTSHDGRGPDGGSGDARRRIDEVRSESCQGAHRTDCLNARIAVERLAQDHELDPAEDKKREEEFERRREQLRVAQEKLRQDQEAKTKVDAYSLPVVPVDPAQPGKADPPPVAGATTP